MFPYVRCCSLSPKKEYPVSPVDPDRPVLSTGEVRYAIGGRLTTTKVQFLASYSNTSLKFHINSR